MSVRLTTEYMPSNEGAFGVNGAIGDDGESLVCSLFNQYGIQYIHNKSNIDKQNVGKDFEILINRRLYGVDVKTNISENRKPDVCIDWTCMSKSHATFWLHVNINDIKGDIIIYKVEDMKRYIINNHIPAIWYMGSDLRFVSKKIARML